VLLALAASTASAALAPRTCPGSAGKLVYGVGAPRHAVELARCTDRVAGQAPGRAFQVAGVTASGHAPGIQRLRVWGRVVFTHWETGPLVPLKLSGDGRWLFFFVDEYGAQSAIADGVPLLVVSTRGGAVHDLGPVLPQFDSITWCAGRAVYVSGRDRVVIDGKRLLVAAPPDWRPWPLWDDPARTFGSPACEPGSSAVAVLSQHTSKVANFFATRWRLWRVGFDGSRHVIDIPPPGWADEQPTWSPDGASIAFVRERNGYGRIMIRRHGLLYGPIARLGYEMGYYGHHDWGLEWRP
jgi:hypothetical protein